MKPPLKFLAAAALALALIFAFNSVFLDLSARPRIDQILLTLLPAAALGYLILNLPAGWIQLEKPQVELASIKALLKEHAPGIALSLIFLAVYLWLGLRLNFPNIDTTDNFLDADNFPWMQRIAAPNGYNYEMRGPHPFAYFIFRPLGWTLNLFTQNPSFSAVLLNVLVGALCVFFAWLLIKRQTGNAVYALLIAAALGLSTAHLFLGSVVETYIFSAAAMMLFVLLLQAETSSPADYVGVSLLTFGITLTNFAQNFIGYAVRSFQVSKTLMDAAKALFRFAAVTLSIGILLTILHAAWYPDAKIFFLLSDTQGEQNFAYSIFAEPSWRAVGRVLLLARTLLLYAIIAPKPYVFVNVDGGDFPRFNFFKIVPGTYSLSAYDGIGNLLVADWALLLLAAGAMFLVKLFRSKKADLTLTFALCVAFNFLLHINYGYEPFLYSPDWTYALVFFVAFALEPLARNRLFQAGLLSFLILLAYNQILFFQFIFATIQPYLK